MICYEAIDLFTSSLPSLNHYSDKLEPDGVIYYLQTPFVVFVFHSDLGLFAMIMQGFNTIYCTWRVEFCKTLSVKVF